MAYTNEAGSLQKVLKAGTLLFIINKTYENGDFVMEPWEPIVEDLLFLAKCQRFLAPTREMLINCQA